VETRAAEIQGMTVTRLSCLAALALFAVGAGTAAAQTPEEQPRSDVLLRANNLIDDRENGRLIAEGDVEIRVDDRVLRADRVVYDVDAGTLRAQGRVQIVQPDGVLQFADEIEIDEEFENGFATRFATRLSQNAIATASAAIRQDGTRNLLEQVVYTACPVCEGEGQPTWSLRARRAVQNQDTQMISYQDAVLEVKGVPVLYVPYFAHPDPTSGRRSGLLTPDLGLSSKLGAFYEQPYYWAISPSQELTIAPMVAANVRPLIKLDYRKRFFSGFIDAESSFTQERDFDSNGEKFGDDTWRSHLYGGGRFDISESWRWGFGVERQTDDFYDLRYDIDGENDPRGLFTSQSRELLTQVYTQGQSESFYLEAAAFSFQSLLGGVDDAQQPTVAPTLLAQRAVDLGAFGRVSAELSALALLRNEPVSLPDGRLTMDTARASFGADWQHRGVFGPGLVVEPFLEARGDVYRLDDGAGAETLSRAVGVGGAQVSWPLMRRAGGIDLLVEPLVMAAYGSEDPLAGELPNEDSLLFETDTSNLFEPSVFAGYDLWEEGGRAAAGVRASATSAKWQVTSTLGRRWRESSDFVGPVAAGAPAQPSDGDNIGALAANYGSNLRFSARFRLDDDLELKRLDVEGGVTFGRVRGDVRYFQTDRETALRRQEAIELRGGVDLTRRWSASYARQYNITLEQTLYEALGLTYRDDCSEFTLAYLRSGVNDRTIGPSESISFTFTLATLGAFGNNAFD
jgi:LPS-assembly protein